MVRFANITVVLLDGATLAYKNATLKEVVKDCLSYPLANKNPLLIKITEGYNLYFNTQIFVSWVQNEINMEELLQELKVDYLVRNKEFLTIDGIAVEDDSLWLVKNNLCILADTDTFVAVKIDNRFKIFN